MKVEPGGWKSYLKRGMNSFLTVFFARYVRELEEKGELDPAGFGL